MSVERKIKEIFQRLKTGPTYPTEEDAIIGSARSFLDTGYVNGWRPIHFTNVYRIEKEEERKNPTDSE